MKIDQRLEKAYCRQEYVEELFESIVIAAEEEIKQHALKMNFGQEMEKINSYGLGVHMMYLDLIYLKELKRNIANLAVNQMPERFRYEGWTEYDRDVINETTDLYLEGDYFAERMLQPFVEGVEA